MLYSSSLAGEAGGPCLISVLHTDGRQRLTLFSSSLFFLFTRFDSFETSLQFACWPGNFQPHHFTDLAAMYKPLLFSWLPALAMAQQNLNPNPDPNFNPATSAGTLGPFAIPQQPAAGATGGPPVGSVDARTLQAMQLAASNWFTDTGIVSLFQNNGPITADPDQFRGIADGAFKAEVDELTQKAVLDQVIGNDPRVSLANLTLTNGVFQSVVDNLQIMSTQGQARASLISTINSVRCTQILPAIDTYFIVAAEYIGDNAQQRRAIRPNACAQILAASGSASFARLPVCITALLELQQLTTLQGNTCRNASWHWRRKHCWCSRSLWSRQYRPDRGKWHIECAERDTCDGSGLARSNNNTTARSTRLSRIAANRLRSKCWSQ